MYGLQRLGGQLRFAVGAGPTGGYEVGIRGVRPRPGRPRVRIAGRGEIAHDAQEQLGHQGQGTRTGVLGNPAERRHGGVGVHAGPQNGQFPLVR
ncbi:hypothetical protein, partial [Streptomyces sp. MBT67]|uniref:hypothetical protein n=1 Tax=Streptomyces sp. MBT67 TaxID=1488397 RepID=UPI001F2005CA